MTRKVVVTPGTLSALQAKVGLVIVALFLVFGVVFAIVVIGETSASEPDLLLLQGAFFLIWGVACIAMMVMMARVASAPANPEAGSLIDVHFDDATTPPEPARGADFEQRLRQLEALKRDGLVSDTEYRSKRSQILDEKW